MKKKKNPVFGITLALSVLIHLMIFMQMSGLFRIKTLSIVELTLKENLKPPAPRILKQPKRPAEPSPDTKPPRLTKKTVVAQSPSLPDIKTETTQALPMPDDQTVNAVTESIVPEISAAAVPGRPAPADPDSGTDAGTGTAKDYYRMVQMKIESQKQYPKAARQQNQEGRVTVYFIVDPDGGISDLKIVKGSRFKLLDEAALEAVNSCAPFPKLPPALFQGPVKLQLSILFELT